MILGRRQIKNRKFDYTQTYYNPEKERLERGHEPIRFRRVVKNRQSTTLFFILFMILAVIYLIKNMESIMQSIGSVFK